MDERLRSDGGVDDGLGLIELIVAMLVSTIVMIGVGTILINSWLAQKDVLSTSEATNRGQLVSSVIERAMRNAIDFEVRQAGVAQATGTELWVHTSLPGALACQAFLLDDGTARMKFASIDLDLTPWGEWLDDNATRPWQARVKQANGKPFFSHPGAPSGRTVEYAFDVETDLAPVEFRGEASKRYIDPADTEGDCW